MLPDLSIHARVLRGPRQHVRLSGRGGIDDGDQQHHTLLSHSGGLDTSTSISILEIYLFYLSINIYFRNLFRYFALDIICNLSAFTLICKCRISSFVLFSQVT